MCNKVLVQCNGKKFFDFVFVIIVLMVRFHHDSFSNDKIVCNNLSQETSSRPPKSVFI